MKRKEFVIGCLISASLGLGMSTPVYAGFQEHYTLAQQYFFNARYSSAIDEFKKALMINFTDNSARIGLINSYIARGSYIANYEHNYRAAADDFRSAIFYLKYYVDKEIAMNSFSSISTTANSLHFCEKQYGAGSSAEAHYKLAEELNATGNFPASMYEYEQIVNISTRLLRVLIFTKRTHNCNTNVTTWVYSDNCQREENPERKKMTKRQTKRRAPWSEAASRFSSLCVA